MHHIISDHNSQNQKMESSRNDQRPFKRSKVIRKTSAQEPPLPHRPHLDQESSTSRNPRKKSRSETSSDGEAQSSAGSCKWTTRKLLRGSPISNLIFNVIVALGSSLPLIVVMVPLVSLMQESVAHVTSIRHIAVQHSRCWSSVVLRGYVR